MRSSKSRSRGKSNRRSVGNIVNRVFDSSGPEGKVRGTPQQIIDKYQTLARDAALANDRVAAENFQQHAEHYTRLLGDAQREQEARRESQEAQQQSRRERNTNGDGRDTASGSGDQPQPDLASDVVDLGDDGDSGLVETPESSAKKPRSRRRKSGNPDGGNDDGDSPSEAKAAE